MALADSKKETIRGILRTSIKRKLARYKPEPAAMPFHVRLLGKDRMALYSFIHSLSTSFGTGIFEPVAKCIAADTFSTAETQKSVGKEIGSDAQDAIEEIINDLTTANTRPNKSREIEKIRRVCQKGKARKLKLTKVDLALVGNNNEIYFFDLKTAKPNIDDFKGFKRTLLQWIAVYLRQNPSAVINTLIAIPYNPYAPKPYERWTIGGMLDLEKELKVAENFWNFLGGDCTYNSLLDCFEEVGIELRKEIDEYFERFKTK